MEAEVGMLVVETIGKIRRAYFVDGRPIKAICRELGVSRKVVRKVIRSQATEFRYERETQPLPKMGPWSAELDRLLAGNESKAARERLTLIRLFEELRGLGYAGGYDAVRRYARRWSKERGTSTASAYVPLSFAPGEAYQFDWSHEVVLLSGTTVMVKAAHVRLCHSRMLFVRAYPRETQEMVFDALGLPSSRLRAISGAHEGQDGERRRLREEERDRRAFLRELGGIRGAPRRVGA
jgi:transposase-like protein